MDAGLAIKKFLSVCGLLLFLFPASYSQSSGKLQFVQTAHLENLSSHDFSVSMQTRIDSLSAHEGRASGFCKFYTLTMKLISEQIKEYDSSGKAFINNFLDKFARIFLDEFDAFNLQKLSGQSNWHSFLTKRYPSEWKLVLAGVNAHINGDMWIALSTTFSEQELMLHKKEFLDAQKSLKFVVHNFFNEIEKESKAFKTIYKMTPHLAEWVGGRILYKWRHRQYELALAFYSKKPGFERLLSRVKIKKEKIDRLLFRSQ